MKEEIFEVSLTPEIIKYARESPATSVSKGTSGFGAYGYSISAMKAPVFDYERMWTLLRDSYDAHQHSGPSSTAQRLYDEIDLAIQGCDMEQGGIVFKNHDTPTTRSVLLVQRVVDKWAEEHHKKRIELFGGVVLNYSVGGLNPYAVIAAYRLKGKYVWLPNLDANHHRKVLGHGEGEGIDIIDENDNVVPKMKEILELMAETDMVLATSHTSTRERIMVVREAVKMGVQRIQITHVGHPMSRITLEQAKIFADLGAYIEICCHDLSEAKLPWNEVMDIYKAVGPERIVLGTDCGHPINSVPWDGMRRLILGFLYRGVPDNHVKLMCQTNAYNLLH